MPFKDWDEVALAAESILSTTDEPFQREMIKNARDVLTICRCASTVPDAVEKGYWSTLRMIWDKFELEICDDRIEVYRYKQPQLQVWYEEHTPAQSFSSRFLSEQPKACGEAGAG